MAFGILQTFLKRVESLGIVGNLPELSTILRQFQVVQNAFEEVDVEIVEEERPPMIEIKEYREKFETIR
jgi:glucosyl-3-phosphoglycerate synthase